jgi:hypothetical protein
METQKYLDALEDVLSKRFSYEEYCLYGYQECAVCLQPDDGKWIVYCGERGNRYNEVKCDTVLMACLNVIRKLTHKTEDISAMENELIHEITQQKIA